MKDRLITKQEILDLDPCHCIEKYNITEPITLSSILERNDVNDEDKIWVVIRFLDDKTNRLFAVWCARQVLTEQSDQRSIEACNVAERFANGGATEEELSAARSAAWSAARSAAWSAAESAAWSAARTAARSAWLAAESAAESAQVKQLIKLLKS